MSFLKLGKKIEYISSELPSFERRLVIIGSEKTLNNLSGEWDWKEDAKKSLIPFYRYYKLGRGIKGSISESKPLNIEWISRKELPPAIEIGEAREKFRFPVNHPIDGVMYSCSDLEPDLYVPVAGFHDYMYQARLNAFIEMCGGLGAKEIKILYAEENGKDITAKVKGKNIPTSVGNADANIDGTYTSRNSIEDSIYYSFDPPTQPLKEFRKAWINAEPTWQMLHDQRLNGSSSRTTAEFNHTDEMTISADIAAKLAGQGLNIGGTYSQFVKRKFTFNVEFWPKNKGGDIGNSKFI